MPNNRLQNIAIRYQVLLERLKAHEVNDFVKVFADLDKATRDVINSLAAEGIGQLTRRELTSLLADLRGTNQALLDKSVKGLNKQLEKLAEDAAHFEAKALQSVVKAIIKAPAAGVAYANAIAQPVSATGQLLGVFADDWSKGEVKRLNNIVQRAWGEGWTNQRLISSIRGTKALGYKDGILATSRRNAEAVARTSIQHVASTARMATWEKNSDIVVGYIWVSTLDSKTTVICRSLDKREFKMGQGPVPPVHINCRSAVAPKVDPALGLDFLDKGATRSAANGPVSADMSYYDWLKVQSPAFQKQALGATRAKLFQSGGLSADKFAALQLNKNFQPMTLDDMRKIAPVAFERAGIPNP